MMIIFYLLLMLRVGRCELEIFETVTVGVGDDVTLNCTRKATGTLFWFRVVSGDSPQVVGKTFSYEKDPRITATETPGLFLLHIKKVKLSDSAFYFCMKKHDNNFIFLRGTHLRVKEPEPTAGPPSDPVRPGDSMSLLCSVLSDSENKSCPGGHSVCCLRAGSHQRHTSLSETEGNSVGEHEQTPEGLLTNKCVFSFFKNVSSSSAGTCFCAVATCEEIIPGNGSKLNTEALDRCDSQQNNSVLFLLCAALVTSLIVIAFLVYSIKKLKKKSCGCCNTAVVLQINAASAGGSQQSQQTDEDSLVYSAPTFTSRKTSKGGTRDPKTDEEESIYSDVRRRDSQ